LNRDADHCIRQTAHVVPVSSDRRGCRPLTLYGPTRGSVLAAVIICACVGAADANANASARASKSTTAPGAQIEVPVHITDSRINIPARLTAIPRGVDATFYVLNVGKRKHSFTVLGTRTRVLTHGEHASISVLFLKRGRFPFRSTKDSGIGFHGFIDVY
jgi:hypothetical protein